MTYREAIVRVVMTALQAALGVVVAAGSGLLDVAVWRSAGLVALVTLVAGVHRLGQAWLDRHGAA